MRPGSGDAMIALRSGSAATSPVSVTVGSRIARATLAVTMCASAMDAAVMRSPLEALAAGGGLPGVAEACSQPANDARTTASAGAQRGLNDTINLPADHLQEPRAAITGWRRGAHTQRINEEDA